MTDPQTRSAANDGTFASEPHFSITQPHLSPKSSAKLPFKADRSDQKLCGMDQLGKPLPAGLSGMPGPSKKEF